MTAKTRKNCHRDLGFETKAALDKCLRELFYKVFDPAKVEVDGTFTELGYEALEDMCEYSKSGSNPVEVGQLRRSWFNLKSDDGLTNTQFYSELLPAEKPQKVAVVVEDEESYTTYRENPSDCAMVLANARRDIQYANMDRINVEIPDLLPPELKHQSQRVLEGVLTAALRPLFQQSLTGAIQGLTQEAVLGLANGLGDQSAAIAARENARDRDRDEA